MEVIKNIGSDANFEQLVNEVGDALGLNLFDVDGYVYLNGDIATFMFNGDIDSGGLTLLDSTISSHVPKDYFEQGSVDINDYFTISDDEEWTTSKNYQNKATLTLINVLKSEYKINFYSELGKSSDKGGAVIQCTVNDIEIASMELKPKDKKHPFLTFGGFDIRELSGDIDIKINWKKGEGKDGTSKCRRARIEIIKLG